MKLTLLHGRHDPNQNMDRIGFKGPETYGIASIKLTYMETIRLEVCCVYTSDEEAAEALYRALTRLHGNDVNFTE